VSLEQKSVISDANMMISYFCSRGDNGLLVSSELFGLGKIAQTRLENLKKSKHLCIGYSEELAVTIVFARYIFFVPNITWLVHSDYQRQGLGTDCLRHFLESFPELFFVTALCRNGISRDFAKKNGFFVFGKFAFLIRRRILK